MERVPAILGSIRISLCRRAAVDVEPLPRAGRVEHHEIAVARKLFEKMATGRVGATLTPPGSAPHPR